MSKLPGLRSRWMMPIECRYVIPLHTPVPITITASGLSSGLVWMRSKSDPPGTSSVTMQMFSSSTTAPNSFNTCGWSSIDKMSISFLKLSIVCWCVMTLVRNTFFTATCRFCFDHTPLNTCPYAPEASGFGSSLNSFMSSISYRGAEPLRPVIIVAYAASSPPDCWKFSMARFTSWFAWHCFGSSGNLREHFVQRPPNFTRFAKHTSQKVHLHSEFSGVTGLLNNCKHTGHSRAPCPFLIQRTMAVVPSKS
mmetsp:Transcript_8453/g.16820  ORF Transcript_8453/g.16820 Transcript_8453/m.16820 type:complete len:251 (+) Transcript_8453:492-1244(+)